MIFTQEWQTPSGRKTRRTMEWCIENLLASDGRFRSGFRLSTKHTWAVEQTKGVIVYVQAGQAVLKILCPSALNAVKTMAALEQAIGEGTTPEQAVSQLNQ